MMRLSTTSMSAMDAVSEANASDAALRKPRPWRTSGSIVRAYPKMKASTTESATVAQFRRPKETPTTIPSTSPIAHPVKQ